MMKFEHVLARNEKQTILKIEGLTHSMSILHITDSHMNETDFREGDAVFEESLRTYSFDAIEARNQFANSLRYANERSMDYVVMTGDIVNGATINNLDYLDQQLQTLRAPYLYTFGNHDWEYPHLPWCEETRVANYPKFDRFTKGMPGYRASTVNGVKLLVIDNSDYQITNEQLEFAKRELADGIPALLFLHIPIYIPSLLSDVMKEHKSPIMMGVSPETWDKDLQVQWQVEDATETTKQFYRLLLENPYRNLTSVFCGHIHFSHTDAFGKGSYQYVTQAGYLGGYRVIHLLPKT